MFFGTEDVSFLLKLMQLRRILTLVDMGSILGDSSVKQWSGVKHSMHIYGNELGYSFLTAKLNYLYHLGILSFMAFATAIMVLCIPSTASRKRTISQGLF